jgi:hypothetical protein
MIRLEGGRLLPENEEEAVRAALKGRGHINVTGYDNPDRWHAAMEVAKALSELKGADFEKERPRLPFEFFASQLGLQAITDDIAGWMTGMALTKKASGSGYFQGAYTSIADDSVWVLEYDESVKEFWIRFTADNIFELPDRYNLPSYAWFYPCMIKAECSWDSIGPWPKGGTSLCELQLSLLGREQKLAVVTEVNGPGDTATDWKFRTSHFAERGANTETIAGAFNVLHQPPHLFAAIHDAVLRKFLAKPEARNSRVYKFLQVAVRDAVERDLLSRFGEKAGIPPLVLDGAGEGKKFETPDHKIVVLDNPIEALLKRAGIPPDPAEENNSDGPVDF